jgi:hypothetical protein
MLRWLNSIRREGEREVTAIALTVKRVASTTEATFRELVKNWGG